MIRKHSTRLSQAHDEEPEDEQGQHRTAAADYPEMGTVLSDRPDPGRVITVIGVRRTAAAYGTPEDARNEDYNGGEGDLGMNWAEPANQDWVHEHLGPQQEAPPPIYDPDMSPVMARLAQIEEARRLVGTRHHATDINGTHVDDAGDAPSHGTVPRASDPDSYDARSTEGQGDDRWNQPLPQGNKEEENAATVGMYPEGMSAGGGPGLEIGAFTAHVYRGRNSTELERHLRDEHGMSDEDMQHLTLSAWHTRRDEMENAHARMGGGRAWNDWDHETVLAHHRLMTPAELNAHMQEQHGVGTAGGSAPGEMNARHVLDHSNSAEFGPNGPYNHGPLGHELPPEHENHEYGETDAPDEHDPDPDTAASYTHHEGPIDPVFGARTAALSPAELGELHRHIGEDHAFPVQEGYGDAALAAIHEGLHMSGLSSHSHGDGYESDPGWEDHAGGYHEFTGSRRTARVPWTGKERGQLHRWQEAPSGTWGDFVPSGDFPLLGPGEHVHHEDEGEGDGIGPVEAAGNPWEEHLRRDHGLGDRHFNYARERGDHPRDIHEALHAGGMAAHKHPEHDPDQAREQSLANMFGPDITSAGPRMKDPSGYPLALDEHGGSGGGDPVRALTHTRDWHPRPPENVQETDPARFRRMMSALNVHVRIDGKEVHDHDDDGPDAPAQSHEHDDPGDSLDDPGQSQTNPDGPGQNRTAPDGVDNKSSQVSSPGDPDNPDSTPDNAPDNPDNPMNDPASWPQAGADVSERGRAYTQGRDDGKVTRGGAPAGQGSQPVPFSPDDGDSGGGGDQPDDSSDSDEDTPFSKGGALAMFTAAASSPAFRFEFTAAWHDVVSKAKRIRAEGHVRITHASAGMVIGEVRGDHDTYESGIQRPVGRRQAIQHWACGCPWASFKQDKHSGARYAGRPCSHVMALQFEAQSRGMFGHDLDSDAEAPSWAPQTVVVKSYPPYDGAPHRGRWSEEWRAPLARRRATPDEARDWHWTPEERDEWERATGAPAHCATVTLLRAGEDPGTVGALRLLAGLRATADQANAPWGADNVSQHPTQKPYGATSPPNPDQDPGSYGPLAAPDPANWGGIDEGSVMQMPLSNTAVHQVLVPGAHQPVPGDLHWPGVEGWQPEDQGTFGYQDRAATAGPSTAMDPRDPQGIRMEEALASGTEFPLHGTVPQLDGALAELHDHPEPALPSTTGDDEIEATAAADGTIGGGDAGTGEGQGAAEDTAALGEFGASVRAGFRQMFGGTPMGDLSRETSPQAQQPSPVGQEPGMGSGDDYLSPDDSSIQTTGNQQWSGGGADSDEVDVPAGQPQGGIEDVVASFQRSAAAKGYSGTTGGGQADGDIAAAARQYLSKTADVLPQAEADELIREGRGQRARNLDLLRLEGTHYEDEDDDLARKGISLDDYDDDVMFA